MDPAALPDGLTARPMTVDDVDAVVAMVNECELHDTGEPMWERADLLSDSSTEGFDRDRDWVVVLDGERPVGWGMVLHLRSAWVDVHPSVRGRGVGTWLRGWTLARAREKGAPRVGSTINDRRADAVALFRAAGYTPRYTSWILRSDHEERPPDPELPEGVRLRAYRPEDEVETLTMFEEAFQEFADRLPSTLDTWRAMTVRREGFSPEDLMLAEADGRIVGGAFILDADEIWVDKLATHRDYRHRGIARALLHLAFQRSFDRGYTRTRLSTDSKSGALSLYERVGMR
ncbi:MAG TPA: GNAT family N-acetyltransferase, partial [Actinomycetota bacterium]